MASPAATTNTKNAPKPAAKGPKAWLARVLPKPAKRPGSGIPARKSIQVLVWVRRFVQTACIGLFLYFLFNTAFRGSFTSAETVSSIS